MMHLPYPPGEGNGPCSVVLAELAVFVAFLLALVL